jgi:type IV pilus assembly protein PilB
MLDQSQVAQLLGSTEIFSKLEPRHLDAIAKACKVVRYEERARIVNQGEVGQELYIIAKGEVSILQEDKALGIEQPILTLGKGQSFGESSLLAESPRSATCKALTETHCVVLAQRSFDSVLRQIPEVGLEISRYLAARLHHQCQLTGFRFVSYQDLIYDPELYGTFPEELLRRLKAIPLKLSDGILTVALTKPNKASSIQALREAAPGLAIEPVACAADDYDAFIQSHRATTEEGLPTLAVDGSVKFKLGSGEEVGQPLAGVLSQALGGQSSHILLQPCHGEMRVLTPSEGGLKELVKLDGPEQSGALQNQMRDLFFPNSEGAEISTASLLVGSDRLYLQLSKLPTLSGPRYSLRLMEPKRTLPPATQLLPHETLRETVMGKLQQAGQLVVLAGAPRSGRSTTGYALLHHLFEEQSLDNILTLESSPLANFPEISQVKVNGGWEGALEAALMQMPELLYLDELDTATLPLVLRVADSGHTTLACYSSAHPLLDLSKLSKESDGVSLEPLGLLLQQTLLPRLCPHCRTDYEPSGSVKGQLVRSGLAEQNQLFFHSPGCSKCRGSGVMGRVPVLEALTMNPMIREMVRAGRPEEAIRKAALGGGLLVPYTASVQILMKQGEVGATTALRFFGRVR